MAQPAQLQHLAQLIARHAAEDGRHESAIDFLFWGRSSRPFEPTYHAQWASFALVAQGGKALRMSEEVIHYGPSDLLLVTMDMPVRSCVTVVTPEEPNLGIGISINESRLMHYLDTFPLTAAQTEVRIERGIAAHKVSPLLVDGDPPDSPAGSAAGYCCARTSYLDRRSFIVC